MNTIVFRNGLTSFLIGLILVSGCSSDGGQNSGKDAPRGGGMPALPVDVIVLRLQPLSNIIYVTGTLMANEEVELRSEMSGRITAIRFSEGSWVRKGDLLVKINDQDLQAQLKKAESQEQLYREEEKRKKALYDKQLLSQEEYDNALNKLRTAEAEKELLKAQIAKTEIYAPFSGKIGLRYVSEGGYVTPNLLIATLQELDPVKVEFAVPEQYSRFVKNGADIKYSIVGSDRFFKGSVYAVESRIDPVTRTIKARARSANPDFVLVPGSFAKIELTLEEIKDALVVPSETLVPDLNTTKIFTYHNGMARPVPVKTGIRLPQSVQITQGVSAGDTIITTGLMQIREGSAVQIRTVKIP